jgi:hypothetical protein
VKKVDMRSDAIREALRGSPGWSYVEAFLLPAKSAVDSNYATAPYLDLQIGETVEWNDKLYTVVKGPYSRPGTAITEGFYDLAPKGWRGHIKTLHRGALITRGVTDRRVRLHKALDSVLDENTVVYGKRPVMRKMLSILNPADLLKMTGVAGGIGKGKPYTGFAKDSQHWMPETGNHALADKLHAQLTGEGFSPTFGSGNKAGDITYRYEKGKERAYLLARRNGQHTIERKAAGAYGKGLAKDYDPSPEMQRIGAEFGRLDKLWFAEKDRKKQRELGKKADAAREACRKQAVKEGVPQLSPEYISSLCMPGHPAKDTVASV